MENMNTNIDDTLLAKYLEGSTTELESAEVESWIASNAKNKQVFEHFQMIWNKTQGAEFNSEIRFDKKAAFQKVLDRIEQESSPNEKKINPDIKPTKLRTLFARAAAVLLVGAGIYFIQHYFRQAETGIPTENTELLTSNSPFTVLPDSSTIHLNNGGKLTYEKNFIDNRSLSLSGEAFFEVTHKNNASFTVAAGDIEVKVLGTSFYVSAYENDSLIEVGIKTGKVQVLQKSDQQSVILKANESITFNKNNQSFGVIETLNANALFWMTGVLEFKDQPLSHVLDALSKAYEQEIHFNSAELETCNFTGRFKNTGLLEIIDLLKASFALEVTSGEQITITGNPCE